MAMTVKSYLAKTRDPYANLILVLPLFVAYQFGILLTGGVRNGVDFMTDLLFLAAGQNLWTYLAINLGIILAFVVALVVMRDKGNFKLEIWPWVIGESTIYALFLGTGVITIMRHLGMGQLLATGAGGHFGLIDKLVLSIGAGMYEELVFRLILTGGLFWLARRSFLFRFFAGVILAVIYYLRGFAVAVYTHAIYDIMVMVFP
ncbi:MAG: hypothetical protein ABEN55_15165 [Bradymonadaceae bacterium]